MESLEPRQFLSAQYALTDLGTLGGPASFGLDLNESLQIVGRSLTDPSPGSSRAFLWNAAKDMQDLGQLPGFGRSEATGINDHGVVVGTSLNATFDERAFLVPPNNLGNLIDLGSLAGTWSRAVAINNHGYVVGTSAITVPPSEADPIGGPFHAVLWEDGDMIDLGTLGGQTSLAKSINEAGQVVGISYPEDRQQFRAFSWKSGVMSDLGTLGGPASSANDINDADLIVGDADQKRRDENGFRRFHAVLWEQGQITDLGTLGGKFSSALAINNEGKVVGWSETRRKDAAGNRIEHAFLFRDGEMFDLNELIDDDRWMITRAEAINDAGYIVGFGTFSSDFAVESNDDVVEGPLIPRAFVLRPLFPDLVVEIEREYVPAKIVPGDQGKVKVRLTNQGETDAIGPAMITIRVSSDQATGADDSLAGKLEIRKINMGPGTSQTVYIPIIVPPKRPPGTYRLVARVEAVLGIPESDPENNSYVASEGHELVWMFGSFDDRTAVKLAVADELDNALSFTLRGKGFGTVVSTVDGLNVTTDGTSNRTTLTIKRLYKDQDAALHDVLIQGPIRKFMADEVDLHGSFTSLDSVRKIHLADVAGQHMIRIGSDGGSRESVRLYLGQVIDTSLLSEIPIGMIQSSVWISTVPNTHVIEGPGLDRLLIGKPGRTDVGEFNVDLRLSGIGVDQRRMTLGRVDVAGPISGGHWIVTGHAGKIVARQIDPSWQAEVLGSIRKIQTDTDFSGRLSAESVGVLDVGRDLHDAQLSLGPLITGRAVLGRMVVARRMQSSTVRAAGNIGMVALGAAEDVGLFAGIRTESVGLPTGVEGFASLSSIARLRIRGLRGAPASVVRTQLAAWSIGAIHVARAATPTSEPDSTDNLSTLSVVAHGIRSLIYRGSDRTLRLRRPEDFFSVSREDLSVRIV